MKPDYDLIRKAIQTAWESDPANRSEYARAKWEIDMAKTYRMGVMESLKDAREKTSKLYQSINTGDVSMNLEDVLFYLDKAIDAQHDYETREDNDSEYYDNKRKESGEWQ